MYPSDRGIQLHRFWWFEVTIFTGVQLWELVQFVNRLNPHVSALGSPRNLKEELAPEGGEPGDPEFFWAINSRHPFWHMEGTFKG